jgi:hypothetical protein
MDKGIPVGPRSSKTAPPGRAAQPRPTRGRCRWTDAAPPVRRPGVRLH